MKKVIFIILLVVSGAFILAPIGSCIGFMCSSKPVEVSADMYDRDPNLLISNLPVEPYFNTVNSDFGYFGLTLNQYFYDNGEVRRLEFGIANYNRTRNPDYDFLVTRVLSISSVSLSYVDNGYTRFIYTLKPSSEFLNEFKSDSLGNLVAPSIPVMTVGLAPNTSGGYVRVFLNRGETTDPFSSDNLESGVYVDVSIYGYTLRSNADYCRYYLNIIDKDDLNEFGAAAQVAYQRGYDDGLKVTLKDITPWNVLSEQVNAFFDTPILGKSITFGTIASIGFGCLLVTLVLKVFLGG